MFPTHCNKQTISVNTWSTSVKNKAHQAWRLKRLVKQPSWRCFLLVVLNILCTVLTLEKWWNGEEQGTPSLMLEKLGQADILQMFPTHYTQQTLHNVNTWSTLVNNKVHQAWRLKRLVKQTSWRCFLLTVLNRPTVLPLEAKWWRTRNTKLDAWNVWSSKHLVVVFYLLY